MEKYLTYAGDGGILYQTKDEMAEDIQAGAEDGARRAKVEGLTEDEKAYILEILSDPSTSVSVKPGRQVVMTTDVGTDKVRVNAGASFSRPDEVIIAERVLGLDSCDIGCQEYSYKNIKNIVDLSETIEARNALDRAVIPVIYGSMPNLGLYTKPDGMFDNWNELIPAGKVDEARASQEAAVEMCTNDMLYISKKMHEQGVDAINFDTTGASGDGDFLATLKTVEELTRDNPNLHVEVGMASEFVLGTHAKLTYAGERLAGMFPHKQVEMCEKAGVSVFGAVVNTNTDRSLGWNIARVCAMLKECSKVSSIPIHANAGMGVCGMPMSQTLSPGAVSRVDKCLIEICNLDGL
jgi:dimethylamine--corrinoid protein Co-methyltransferase